MAITNNPIIGRAAGKVGGLVFTQWKGRNVIKEKPTIVANPRTEQQQAQRARFVALLALGRMLAFILRLGFKEYAGQVTWLNKFMSTNSFSGAFAYLSGVWQLVPANLVISEGSLYPTNFLIDEVDGNDVTVTFSTSSAANQAPTDLFQLVGMKGTETAGALPVERSTGTMTLTFSSLVNGDVIHLYGFFMRADGTIVSNSIYRTITVGP